MAITPTDFEKIWSSNATTPAYTFSDADYLEGWDFVGNLPPTRAMWNAIQKRTDEKMKYIFDHFGAPLVANTVADMTEQNRVYVYMGSETGYTAGDWYYWDGSAWTDGGVYNAVAIVTDKTLSVADAPADAKVVGDFFDYLIYHKTDVSLFKIGSLSASTGGDLSSTNRMITGGVLAKNIVGFKVSVGYGYAIVAYQQDGTYVGIWNGTTFVKSATWYTSTESFFFNTLNPNYRYKLIIKRTDDADIDILTDGTSVTFICVTDDSLSVDGESADAKATGNVRDALLSVLPLVKIKELTMTVGSIDETTGSASHSQDFTNCLLSSCVLARKGDVFILPNNHKYAFYRYHYDSNSNSFVYDSTTLMDVGYITDKYWASDHDGFVVASVRKLDDSIFTQEELDALNFGIVQCSSAVNRDEIFFDVGMISTAPNFKNKVGYDYYIATSSDSYFNYTRYRTNPITLKAGTTINIATGYRYYIFTLVNGSYVAGSWKTDETTFSNDVTVRIVVDVADANNHVPYTQWPDIHSVITIEEPQESNEDLINVVNDLTKAELRIGELINGHLTAAGVVDDIYTNYRLSTQEIVAFPKTAEKITVKINPAYLVALRTGASSTNLNNNLYWYTDGDIITIPNGDNYYAVSICNASGDTSHVATPISPTEVETIGLKLYVDKGKDVILQNDEACNILSSARLFFSSSELNTLYKYPVVAHTSDCHGDYTRVERFMQFCDNCKIDVACVTGDIVSYQPSQQIKWFNDILLKHDTLPAVCTGNHDVYDNAMDDDDIYDFMFDDVATKLGNTTGKTWYYKDIADKKLRVISVNLYQYGGTSRWYTHFTDEQLAWIVSTLASTPNDYGVIILTHASQVNLDNAKDSNYPTFFQDVRLYNNTHNSVAGGVPLYDIVDAFISRTTLSKTYTQTGSPASVSVSADFTNVDSSVEFIAHLTGHFHQDSICYVPNRTNKQLMLNVTCTNAIYGGSAYPYLADIQDQGRNNTDSSQDAFNVYVIDRDNKTVKVVRVGSNMTYQMAERKYMAIPYAD